MRRKFGLIAQKWQKISRPWTSSRQHFILIIAGTKTFNSNINVSYNRSDEDRNNNRLWVPSSVGVPSGPSIQTHGKLNTNLQFIDNNKNCDRINGDLLNAFKEKPYTQSLYSVA